MDKGARLRGFPTKGMQSLGQASVIRYGGKRETERWNFRLERRGKRNTPRMESRLTTRLVDSKSVINVENLSEESGKRKSGKERAKEGRFPREEQSFPGERAKTEKNVSVTIFRTDVLFYFYSQNSLPRRILATVFNVSVHETVGVPFEALRESRAIFYLDNVNLFSPLRCSRWKNGGSSKIGVASYFFGIKY